MDTKQLKAFLAVAASKNFTAAAQELYISQPALSYQISTLEQEIGVPLFDRSGRKVTITDAGLQLCDGAKDLLEQWEDLCQKVVETAMKKRVPMLSIGYPDNFFHGKLYEHLANFKQKFPDVSITMNNVEFSSLESSLQNGTSDVMFAHNLLDWPADFRTKTLSVNRMAIAVSRQFLTDHGLDHTATCEDILALKNVKVFVIGGFQRGLQGIIDLIRCTFVHQPELVQHRNYLTMLHNSALGVGITFLPEPVLHLIPLEQTLIFPIPDHYALGRATYSAIWHKDNNSSVLREFINSLPMLNM